MAPIIVSSKKDGSLKMVVGASGGPLIVTAVLQTLTRVLLLGMPPDEAVSGQRVHHQLLPNELFMEDLKWGQLIYQIDPQLKAALEGRGQLIRGVGSLGVSQTIVVSPKGSLLGVSDARKDGAPDGF